MRCCARPSRANCSARHISPLSYRRRPISTVDMGSDLRRDGDAGDIAVAGRDPAIHALLWLGHASSQDVDARIKSGQSDL
jgi:hypothetical protein